MTAAGLHRTCLDRGALPMTDLRKVATKLRDIAKAVRFMPPPSSHDPEAFHLARSERAHEIDLIAQELAPDMIPNGHRRALPNTNGMPRSPRRS